MEPKHEKNPEQANPPIPDKQKAEVDDWRQRLKIDPNGARGAAAEQKAQPRTVALVVGKSEVRHTGPDPFVVPTHRGDVYLMVNPTRSVDLLRKEYPTWLLVYGAVGGVPGAVTMSSGRKEHLARHVNLGEISIDLKAGEDRSTYTSDPEYSLTVAKHPKTGTVEVRVQSERFGLLGRKVEEVARLKLYQATGKAP
jgi:hypothetical protein